MLKAPSLEGAFLFVNLMKSIMFTKKANHFEK